MITSPKISREGGFLVGGNYYFSLNVKEKITEVCFPIFRNSTLFCFRIHDLLDEKDFKERGWIKNQINDVSFSLIVPPYRYGFYIEKPELSVGRVEAYSKIFWKIKRKVLSIKTTWLELPVYFSELGSVLPAIAFNKDKKGLYVAIGDTPDRAAVNSVHLSRVGRERLKAETAKYLRRFQSYSQDKRMYDNTMVALFLSNGICIDADEDCILASKSPKYYVSTAFWSRDFAFWVLPVIERFDSQRAKALIKAMLMKYWKNKGVHALYIDGRVLYEGFELDQFSHYFSILGRALEYGIIGEENAKKYVRELTEMLERRKSKRYFLYSTDLNSSDDPVKYPYVTFDNVLLWYSIRRLAKALKDSKERERLLNLSKRIRTDIMKELVHDGRFVYSSDLQGGYEIYDDPTGSLILLPYFGFVRRTSQLYKRTMTWIESKENPFFIEGKFPGEANRHVRHPWLHYFASLIMSSESKGKVIESMPLDDGLMCETIDEKTGRCLTGIHFPGASGFFVQARLKKDRV